MANRKKRLQKGIDSLEQQIMLHQEKLRKAEEENHIELADYYRKEIAAKKMDKEEKERLLKKGG
ncbi:MAG TPA: hypothetical protein VJJ75_02015 [Candidatus Nanoarchaeia archaeon]|nr:hypothetical protein [Candidatus Nanoarchaeia archaeon]